MEISHYVFSFVASFLVILIFRQIDKKRSGMSMMKRFIDMHLKNFSKNIDEKKQELYKASTDMELLLNKGNAISAHVNNHLKEIDKKLSDMEKSEKTVETLKNRLDEMKQYTDQIAQDMGQLKKEKELVKNARVEITELTRNYKEVSRKSIELEKNILDEMENKRVLLDKKMQENMKRFETFLKNSLEDMNKDNTKKISVLIGEYQKGFRSWFEDKRKEMEEMNLQMQNTRGELDKIKSGTLTQIEKDVKEKLAEIHQQFEVSKEKIGRQNEAVNQFRSQVYNEFNQKFREFQNETETVLAYSRNQVQRLDDDFKKVSQEFKRDLDIQVRDVSLKISGFEESLKQIDKIAQDHENRMSREIEARANDIEQNLKNRFDSIQGKVNTVELGVKDILKNFQQKISDEMQNAYHQVDLHKNKMDYAQREMENKIQTFIASSDSTVQSKLKELSDVYEKGKSEIDKKVNTLSLDFMRLNNAFRAEMKEGMDQFKLTLEREKEEIMNDVGDSIKTLRREMDNHLVDVSEKILSFEQSLQKVDKIAKENEDKINREIEVKVKEIDLNLQSRFDSVQNRVNSMDVNVKDLLKKFQDKVSGEMQMTYQDMDSYRKNIQETYQAVEKKINQFVSSSEVALSAKAQELSELYEKGRLDLERKVSAYYDEMSRSAQASKSEFKDDFNTFKATYEKEKETLLSGAKETLKTLEEYREKLKKDFDENFLQTQRNMFQNEIAQLKASMEETQKNMESRVKGHSDELKNLMTQKEEEFIKQFNQKRDELNSRLNEYQVTVEGSLQRGGDRMKEFVDQFQDILKTEKAASEEKLEIFLKQEKAKMESLESDMDNIRFKFEAEMKKQSNQLQSMAENVKNRFAAQMEAVESHFTEKEKLMLTKVEEKSEAVSKNVGDLEERLRTVNTVLLREVGKGAKEIRNDLTKMEKEFEDHLKTSMNSINDEVLSLREEIDKIKDRSQEIQKSTAREVEGKIRVFQDEFSNAVIHLEKELAAKKGNLEYSFDEKARNLYSRLEDFQKTLAESKVKNEAFVKDSMDAVRNQILDVEQKLNAFKSDKKLDRFVQEMSNFESMLKRIKSERDFVSDAEKNFMKLKKDSEDLLNELGRFEAKKNEVTNLNERMNEIVAKSKEAEERLFQLGRNINSLSQVESKIAKIQTLYEELQKKAETVESKEIKIRDMVQKIEIGSQFAAELREDGIKLKSEIESIFKKNDFLTNSIKDLQMRVEDVKKGEEKIDHVLSRFSEVEMLSDDLGERLKKMEYATHKLDAAEARIKNLLEIVDSPETLGKVKKAKEKVAVVSGVGAASSMQQPVYGTANTGGYGVDALIRNITPSKRDSIIRFKNTGHKPEVIANILEMRPEEVEAVIKYYSQK